MDKEFEDANYKPTLAAEWFSPQEAWNVLEFIRYHKRRIKL